MPLLQREQEGLKRDFERMDVALRNLTPSQREEVLTALETLIATHRD
ncbi:hypothetical protein GCM10009601_10870 [Streptomyces thermospinosisporus]|uniref:MarR family transcriptional regulator n=1 Tax=Streptomyces thermospinosisporus TaxID=161482 RepID=A0ABP4JA55_9ACTN